jgi:hypothetical protein
VCQIEPAAKVLASNRRRIVGRHSAVGDAVRQAEKVACEPITAHVRAFPGLLRVGRGQGAGNRSPAFGAARVVPSVGTDQEKRLVVPVEIRPRVGCRAPKAQIEHIANVRKPSAGRCRWSRFGVDDVDLRLADDTRTAEPSYQ